MRVFTMLPMRHWRDAGPFAAAAEAAGFDALMTVELGHDVFTPLAFAAPATERIELTPSIAVAFPRSPTVMASQAWDLHAVLLAHLANLHRDPAKTGAYEPADFNPFALRERRPVTSTAPLAALKRLFTEGGLG